MSILAILVSDIHLSHQRPAARAGDWYGAMETQLAQLNQLSIRHDAPIICAGDVFDRWNPPVELVNFALAYLPRMYAIPGQHDLPNHDEASIKKSAYYTMCMAGRITDLRGVMEIPPGFYVRPFRWGAALESLRHPMDDDGNFYLAVAHKYIWVKDCSYHGASPEAELKNVVEDLAGYDAAVFGDNHKGFTRRIRANETKHNLLNCGAFMCRHKDERDYKPAVGLLHGNGNITRHYLDKSHEQWDEEYIENSAAVDTAAVVFDAAKFIEELETVGDSLDFNRAVNRRLDEVGANAVVRKLVLEALQT